MESTRTAVSPRGQSDHQIVTDLAQAKRGLMAFLT